jgi:phosphoribosylformylglycinamidine cyclo-ligase
MNSKSSGMTYRDAGVDIDAGDALVDRIKPLARATLRPEVLAGIGGFGALCAIPSGYREPILVSGTDGVGTKLKLAFALDRHDTIGIDLVAMSVNDILVQGAQPLFFLDYFATGRLSVDVGTAVVSGIAEGCLQSGCALIGGETAEMPGMYADGEYDLAGFAVGVVEKAEILSSQAVADGDCLLGLSSSGFHSNGYSLVRAVLQKVCGGITPSALASVRLAPTIGVGPDQTLDALVMAPTRIYVKSVLAALKAHPSAVHALAHITGGGITGNLPRILPQHLLAELNPEAWPLPAVMQWIQAEGQIDVQEMFRVFNCGIGMVVAVAHDQADAVAATLTAQGERVYKIGTVRLRGTQTEQVIMKPAA